VLVRKVYGVAGAAHAPGDRHVTRFAWPSGDWGSLPIAGGREAADRRELEAAEDPAALRAEIQERLDAVRSPFRTAERFSVEDVVDPRETRPRLVEWARAAYRTLSTESPGGPKARGPRP
jgi:propionyl-CoA carboxylase beta chain